VPGVNLEILFSNERIPEDDFAVVGSAGKDLSVERPLEAVDASGVALQGPLQAEAVDQIGAHLVAIPERLAAQSLEKEHKHLS
jgi:hypothetical protein